VVTSNSVKAIYYLGRYDFELNATIVPETESGTEFGRDGRTGGQAIGTADSIRQVLSLPGRTLVVIESSKIGRASGVNKEAFAVVESHCSELAIAPHEGVRAWWCVTPSSLHDGVAGWQSTSADDLLRESPKRLRLMSRHYVNVGLCRCC
jgi:hypothetical protein